jgi:hypothetical protein
MTVVGVPSNERDQRIASGWFIFASVSCPSFQEKAVET